MPKKYCPFCGKVDLFGGGVCIDCARERAQKRKRTQERFAEVEAELARLADQKRAAGDSKAPMREPELAQRAPVAVGDQKRAAGDSKAPMREATDKTTAWADQADKTAEFMLIHGSVWVHASMNIRALGKPHQDGKAAHSATTVDEIELAKDKIKLAEDKIERAKAKIKRAEDDQLPEPMTQRFRDCLNEDTHWPALCASEIVSKKNLEASQISALSHTDEYNHLCSFHLTLTHYAGAARHTGETLRLFSRHNLDENGEALGILNYSKKNTPDSALKHVGHHDYVFCSIEPRATKKIESVFKLASRFGDVCHALDSDAVNPFALLTLGDLDTMNAKQSQFKLSAVPLPGKAKPSAVPLPGKAKPSAVPPPGKAKPSAVPPPEKRDLYAISVNTSPGVIVDQKITDPNTLKPTTIKVRLFKTRSEQMFLLKDAKQALALKVIELASFYGVDLSNIDAEQYNNLINGWFVPQVMIPRELITREFWVFNAGKLVHPPAAAVRGASSSSSRSR